MDPAGERTGGGFEPVGGAFAGREVFEDLGGAGRCPLGVVPATEAGGDVTVAGKLGVLGGVVLDDHLDGSGNPACAVVVEVGDDACLDLEPGSGVRDAPGRSRVATGGQGRQ